MGCQHTFATTLHNKNQVFLQFEKFKQRPDQSV